MFLLLTNKVQRKTKDFSQIIINLSLHSEDLGITTFKGHLSVAVSVTNNFHCNLQFLF